MSVIIDETDPTTARYLARLERQRQLIREQIRREHADPTRPPDAPRAWAVYGWVEAEARWNFLGFSHRQVMNRRVLRRMRYRYRPGRAVPMAVVELFTAAKFGGPPCAPQRFTSTRPDVPTGLEIEPSDVAPKQAHRRFRAKIRNGDLRAASYAIFGRTLADIHQLRGIPKWWYLGVIGEARSNVHAHRQARALYGDAIYVELEVLVIDDLENGNTRRAIRNGTLKAGVTQLRCTQIFPEE